MNSHATLENRLRRIAVAAACVPPAVLLHELGHWVGNTLAGLPDTTIHYASTGFRDQPAFWTALRAGDLALAETMGSVTGAGIGAFLGIAMSWLLMMTGAWFVRRTAFQTVAAAMVLASAVRFVPVGIMFSRGVAQHTDEAHVAQAFSAPMLLPALVLFGIGLAVACIITMIRRLPVEGRRGVVADLVVGVVLGTVAWLNVVGPALLP